MKCVVTKNTCTCNLICYFPKVSIPFQKDRIFQTTVDKALVPCFPLESLLLALGQDRVDYLTLNTGPSNLDILQAIPFNRVKIQVISVNYMRGKNPKEDYVDMMEKHGYVKISDLHVHNHVEFVYVDDLIFALKST